MAIMAEEVFGPVLPVVTVSDDMDAIGRIAAWNLPAQAIYFGSDPPATLFADRVAADVVFINPAPESFDGAAMAGSLMPGNEQWSGETGFRRFSVARRLVIADDPSQSSLAATRLG
jgi:acyl-CoA reductase-like NAD-dependent aldehyde dehydrogenase